MTVGRRQIGEPGSPGSYRFKQWNGEDDVPAHKAWKRYEMFSDSQDLTPTETYLIATGELVSRAGCVGSIVQYPAADPDNMMQKMQQKLLDAVRDHSFNLAVSIAEGEQTAEFVGQTMVNVFRFFRACHERQPTDILRTFRDIVTGGSSRKLGQKYSPNPKLPNRFKKAINSGDISGAILATSYAWGPLIADVYAAIEAWNTLRKEQPRYFEFKASSRSSVQTGDVSASPGYVIVDGKWWRTKHLTCRLTERLTTLQSLGFSNMASVVWEKTGYSFIVDYIIPIGSWLDNLGLIPKLTMTYCLNDASFFTAKNRGYWKGYMYDYRTYYWRGGKHDRTVVKVSRTIGTKLDVPLPSIKSMEKVFSLGHVRNVAALFHQNFRQIVWEKDIKLPPKKVYRGW